MPRASIANSLPRSAKITEHRKLWIQWTVAEPFNSVYSIYKTNKTRIWYSKRLSQHRFNSMLCQMKRIISKNKTEKRGKKEKKREKILSQQLFICIYHKSSGIQAAAAMAAACVCFLFIHKFRMCCELMLHFAFDFAVFLQCW